MRKLMIYVRLSIVLAILVAMSPFFLAWLIGRMLVDVYKYRLAQITMPQHRRETYLPDRPKQPPTSGWEPTDEGD